MKFEEIIDGLRRGEKYRCDDWSDGIYIAMDYRSRWNEPVLTVFGGGDRSEFLLFEKELNATNWEVYRKDETESE